VLYYSTLSMVGQIKHSGSHFTHGAGNVREEPIAQCIIFSLVAEGTMPHALCVLLSQPLLLSSSLQSLE
jgi:hypothetical protein